MQLKDIYLGQKVGFHTKNGKKLIATICEIPEELKEEVTPLTQNEVCVQFPEGDYSIRNVKSLLGVVK